MFTVLWIKMFNKGYLKNKAPTPNNSYIEAEKEKIDFNTNLTFVIKGLIKIYKPLCKLMITAVNKVRNTKLLLS